MYPINIRQTRSSTREKSKNEIISKDLLIPRKNNKKISSLQKAKHPGLHIARGKQQRSQLRDIESCRDEGGINLPKTATGSCVAEKDRMKLRELMDPEAYLNKLQQDFSQASRQRSVISPIPIKDRTMRLPESRRTKSLASTGQVSRSGKQGAAVEINVLQHAKLRPRNNLATPNVNGCTSHGHIEGLIQSQCTNTPNEARRRKCSRLSEQPVPKKKSSRRELGLVRGQEAAPISPLYDSTPGQSRLGAGPFGSQGMCSSGTTSNFHTGTVEGDPKGQLTEGHLTVSEQKQASAELSPFDEAAGFIANNSTRVYPSSGSLQETPGSLQESSGSLQESPGLLQETPGLLQETPGLLQETPGSLQNSPSPQRRENERQELPDPPCQADRLASEEISRQLIEALVEVDQQIRAQSLAASPAEPPPASSRDAALECGFCARKLLKHSDLVSHVRTHTGEKPYVCLVCERQFSLRGNLNVHMKSHTLGKTHECSVCHKSLSSKNALAHHSRRHTGGHAFECAICKKGVAKKSLLSYHMRSHTGEKPFACGLCNRRFSLRGNLTAHIRMHTREKTYQCPVCQERLPSRNALRLHKQSHPTAASHECSICRKTLSSNAHLLDHLRTHSGDRPFKCPVCPKAFPSSGNLARHTKTHKKQDGNMGS